MSKYNKINMKRSPKNKRREEGRTLVHADNMEGVGLWSELPLWKFCLGSGVARDEDE